MPLHEQADNIAWPIDDHYTQACNIATLVWLSLVPGSNSSGLASSSRRR